MKIENGTSSILYTFNEYELNQHDTEIRKQAYAEGYQQGKFDTLADLEADEHFNRLAEYENIRRELKMREMELLKQN